MVKPNRSSYTTFESIPWHDWVPQERATLLFVRQHDKTLLIRKKRGLGAGKINGPGGRIDPGESAESCAIREVQEELCITPTGIKPAGELLFQFVDGYSLHVYVFTASGYEGTPTETDEATPLWAPENALPYREMWADDRIWLPFMLQGYTFMGRFLFDGDAMHGYTVEVKPTMTA